LLISDTPHTKVLYTLLRATLIIGKNDISKNIIPKSFEVLLAILPHQHHLSQQRKINCILSSNKIDFPEHGENLTLLRAELKLRI